MQMESICNLAIKSSYLEAEFRKGADSKPVKGNSHSNGWWTVWSPVIQHKEGNLTKYWYLAEKLKRTLIQFKLN